MTKLENLIRQARQQPDKLSPAVLAKLNHHLKQTGGELIPLPWADQQTRKPFPPSPWASEDSAPAVVQPTGNELADLKKAYQEEMDFFTANPDQFTNEQHSRLYRVRALISMSEASRKL